MLTTCLRRSAFVFRRLEFSLFQTRSALFRMISAFFQAVKALCRFSAVEPSLPHCLRQLALALITASSSFPLFFIGLATEQAPLPRRHSTIGCAANGQGHFYIERIRLTWIFVHVCSLATSVRPDQICPPLLPDPTRPDEAFFLGCYPATAKTLPHPLNLSPRIHVGSIHTQ